MRIPHNHLDIMTICDVRSGARCKDCVNKGYECEKIKKLYHVSKPYEVLDRIDYYLMKDEREEKEHGN